MKITDKQAKEEDSKMDGVRQDLESILEKYKDSFKTPHHKYAWQLIKSQIEQTMNIIESIEIYKEP